MHAAEDWLEAPRQIVWGISSDAMFGFLFHSLEARLNNAIAPIPELERQLDMRLALVSGVDRYDWVPLPVADLYESAKPDGTYIGHATSRFCSTGRAVLARYRVIDEASGEARLLVLFRVLTPKMAPKGLVTYSSLLKDILTAPPVRTILEKTNDQGVVRQTLIQASHEVLAQMKTGKSRIAS